MISDPNYWFWLWASLESSIPVNPKIQTYHRLPACGTTVHIRRRSHALSMSPDSWTTDRANHTESWNYKGQKAIQKTPQLNSNNRNINHTECKLISQWVWQWHRVLQCLLPWMQCSSSEHPHQIPDGKITLVYRLYWLKHHYTASPPK